MVGLIPWYLCTDPFEDDVIEVRIKVRLPDNLVIEEIRIEESEDE